MAEKETKNQKEKKRFQKEERNRKRLEVLGFVQLVFDFYTTPVV